MMPGRRWRLVNDDRRLRQRAFYYTRIYADPQAKDTVYILNTGLYRSTDAGKIDPRHPRAARRQSRSLDRAERCQADDQQQRRRRQRLDATAARAGPIRTYPDGAVLQRVHDGTRRRITSAERSRTTDGVRPEHRDGELYPVGGGESGYIAPDPEDTDVFYAGSYGGLLTRINRRTGERRSINVWPDNPMGFSSSDITERFQWTFPIVIRADRPQHALRHVAACVEVHERRPELAADQSGSHAPRSVDASEASGGPITLDQTGVETYATIFTLAPSPKGRRQVIWTGSDDGVVHVTRDGGRELDAT